MGDLDVCLIKEFARRPGFYDRSDPHFKDKNYVQQCWAEISHQLGYEANLLKDRMYQLRNRYNLEKRRLENLRMEDPSKNVRSPWPLFYHLTFLDGHIRPRRSYKNARETKHAQIIRTYGGHHVNGGSVNIKYEAEFDSEEDQRTNDNDGSYLDPTNFLADDDSAGESTSQHHVNNNHNVNAAVPPARRAPVQGNGINVRSIESLKRKMSTTSEDHYEQKPNKKMMNNQTAAIAQNGYPVAFGGVGLINKYAAFGQFLAASLSDIEEKTALELIGKFTFEVLKALQEKKSD